MKTESINSESKSFTDKNQMNSAKMQHRKQLSQASNLSHDNSNTGLKDDQYVKKRGFSSQYLNLTKRFKVKLVPHNSANKNINFGKVARLRIKTQQNQKTKAEQLKQLIKKHSLLSPIQFVQIQSKKDSNRCQQSSNENIKTKNISFFKKSRYSPFIEQPLNKSQNKAKINSLRKDYLKQKQKDNLISTRIKSFLSVGGFQINDESSICDPVLKAIPHINTIYQMYSLYRSQVKTQKDVCKKLKEYVFSEQKENHSISYLDKIFKNQMQRQSIRIFLYYQRLTFICLIDLLSRGKLCNLLEQIKIILQTILGTYLTILGKVIDSKAAKQADKLFLQTQKMIKCLQQSHIIKKHTMKQVNASIAHRCYSLYRYNKQLYEEFSKILNQAKQLTINRCFYQILCIYAIYLTDHQELISNNYGLINYFATCPSPYLLTKNSKKYSLVIDLDETLLHSKMKNGKYLTQYRPGAMQLVEQLSSYFQIVIFTSAIKQYANQVVKPFRGISHILYRHHVTRLKGSIIKDLSRLGRLLKYTLILDDLQSNFKLQPENGIKVSQWKGDMQDKQLFVLKDLLLQIGKQSHQDLRLVVQKWKFQSNL